MLNEKSLRLFIVISSILSLMVIVTLYYSSVLNFTQFYSILIGALIVLLNFFIGFLFIKFSLDKSNKLFITMLWGGMAFRLVFVLFLVVIMLKFLELNTFGFIFSILFFYVFYLIIEILYLNLKKTEHFER
ncbi:MAG: ATP synthase subunit I [Ignavibacteria bacterium]|nr:ATP synthase subunit I [Ignavibacteria bacterium]MBT8382597.1 ATP synthase subunit I [Ignavibacteria bacterium]MBT8391168.1 ATP synthase subunit I [Ignavibacteria bacterium]NNJ52612.1 hypothetical protein [Ignavibacteriaceae bacterium]NNL20256.1 hypothetical protein [Ignavibacteriaceae bacterium]